MRSPAILGLKESPFGSDVVSIPSIAPLMSLVCNQESDSSSEPEMESTGDKEINISIDKDSGFDSDNDFKAPDPELVEKIVAQVESIFSDENLVKDEFVLKHIRRNKDGFISLKLLSSFRKVKALTKNWKIVAHCVKVGSKKLELNENETKLRRKIPLPAVDGDKYSRTVIAFNFADGTDDINSISKVFSRFGEIALIRILKSGSSSVIPNHLMIKIKEKYDLSQTTVATVEYYNKSGADKAIAHFEKNNSKNGTQIMSMKSSNTRKSFKWSECSDSNEKKENPKSYAKKWFQNSSKVDISLNMNATESKRPLIMRQKSKSCSFGDESKAINTYVSKVQSSGNSAKFVPIIRMPFGPDGTKGFNTHTKHRSRSM